MWDSRDHLRNQLLPPLQLTQDDLRDADRHSEWVGRNLSVEVDALYDTGVGVALFSKWSSSQLERQGETVTEIYALQLADSRELLFYRLPGSTSTRIQGTLRPAPPDTVNFLASEMDLADFSEAFAPNIFDENSFRDKSVFWWVLISVLAVVFGCRMLLRERQRLLLAREVDSMLKSL